MLVGDVANQQTGPSLCRVEGAFYGMDGFLRCGVSSIHDDVGVNDTPVFLLNEYIVELNPANFNILNQILN